MIVAIDGPQARMQSMRATEVLPVLFLTRRRGEKVAIGNDITVTVLAVEGDKVRLGIEAPKVVAVDRVEVREAKDFARQQQREQPSHDGSGSSGH